MKRMMLFGGLLISLAFAPICSALGQHGGAAPSKIPEAGNLDPRVRKLELAAAKLERQAKAKPNDAKLKLAVAEAFFQAGFASEYSKASLPPAARYRTALKHYRVALNYNPGHVKAKKEKAQIEMIYRQMGRPVPG